MAKLWLLRLLVLANFREKRFLLGATLRSSLILLRNMDKRFARNLIFIPNLIFQLNVWWTQEGQDAAFDGQAGTGSTGGKKNEMVLLDSIMQGANYQQDDKPYWFNSKCYLTYIKKERMMYKGCPGKVRFFARTCSYDSLGRSKMQQEAYWRGWWHVSMREMQSELPEFQLPNYDAGSCKKTNFSAEMILF